MKNTEIRFSRALHERILADLRRPHPFAFERVGFARGVWEPEAHDANLILLSEYEPVSEEHYIDDPRVGVRINSDAIRNAMQTALDGRERGICVFHVHLHDLGVRPMPSKVDAREILPMIVSIARVSPQVPHGFLILSADSASAWVNLAGSEDFQSAGVVVVGSPTYFGFPRL